MLTDLPLINLPDAELIALWDETRADHRAVNSEFWRRAYASIGIDPTRHPLAKGILQRLAQ